MASLIGLSTSYGMLRKSPKVIHPPSTFPPLARAAFFSDSCCFSLKITSPSLTATMVSSPIASAIGLNGLFLFFFTIPPSAYLFTYWVKLLDDAELLFPDGFFFLSRLNAPVPAVIAPKPVGALSP